MTLLESEGILGACDGEPPETVETGIELSALPVSFAFAVLKLGGLS